VIGPDTRQAWRMWQEEHGIDPTGHFEVGARAALIDEAVALITAMTPRQQVDVRGQLALVQDLPRVTGRRAVQYYAKEAQARVDAELVPAFLALYASFNRGIFLPGLETIDYLKRRNAGEDGKTARRLASRYGFLRFSGAAVAAHPDLDLERAAHPGDLEYQFDMFGILLREDGALRTAATKRDERAMEYALAGNAVGCVICGPQTLGETLAEVISTLSRGEPAAPAAS